YGKDHADDPSHPHQIVKSLTTFVGGGGPRFWVSAAPEQSQANYAQILDATIPGVRLDVRRLETGSPVGVPVAIRLSGDDVPTLRRLAGEVGDIFRAIPTAVPVRDNW